MVLLGELTAVRTGAPQLLIEDLLAIVTEDLRLQYETTCNNFHIASTSVRYINDEAELYSSTWFKGFDALNDWINLNYLTASKTTFSTKFNELTGNNLTDLNDVTMYKRNIFRAWDNLVAQIIVLKNEKLREEIAQVIKVYEYSKLVNSEPSGLTLIKTLFPITDFLLILPKVIFPLPEKTNNPLPVTIPASEFDYEGLAEILTNYKTAADELSTVKTYQIQDYSVANYSPSEASVFVDGRPTTITVSEAQPLGNLVTEANFTDMLSVQTRDIITTDLRMNGDIAYANHAVERIQGKVTSLLSAMPAPEVYLPTVVFGGIVTTIDPSCAAILNEDPCGNYIGAEWINNGPLIENLFVADLKVVNKRLKRYEKGEIAHIENVLKSEKRSRVWEKINRVTEEISLFKEDFSETSNETSSSESSSLSVESNNIINKESSFSAGVSVTGTYGVVTASANANYGASNSTTNANSTANNFAKNITTRARARIQKRVSETRKTTSFEEIRETIKQEYDNIGGVGNIAGIYYWVDKVYECTTINYGKRLMIELIIPEPASFYIFSKSQPTQITTVPPKPIDPTQLGHPVLGNLPNPTNFDLKNPVSQIEYLQWASLYNVPNIESPPKASIIVSKSYSFTMHSELYHTKNEDIPIPAGYKAKTAIVRAGTTYGHPTEPLSAIFRFNLGSQNIALVNAEGNVNLKGETGTVPVSFWACAMDGYYINIQIECTPTEETINEWNLKTYNAIMAKYEKDLADFNGAISNAQEEFSFDSNGVVGEEVMKRELKKRSIEMLSQQRFESFDGTINKQGANKYPEIDFTKVREDSKRIKFFEDSFDWNNITYEFYPYFWGRKPRWLTLMKFEGADMNFTAFMQAGAAKIVLPVKPEFSKSILHYINTSQISFTNSEFVSPEHHHLLIDLRDPAPTPDPSDDNIWEIKIPTTHIFLNNEDSENQLPEYFS